MNDVLHDGVRRTGTPVVEGDARFRMIFDAVNDAIFILSTSTGEVIEVNRSTCQMFGYDRHELIGTNIMGKLSSGIPPYTEELAFERIGKTSALGEPEIVEWQCKKKDGTLFWTEVSVRYTQIDQVPVIVSILRDVTERKRLDAEILHMALHDVLTGLPNRSALTTAIEQAIAQSIRTDRSFAVLSLDLDHFKDVNDTRGHLAGDRLLCLVAARLQACVRANEKVARFGGDEFVVLLGDQRDPAEIAVLAIRLIDSISRPFTIDGHEINVGASIGVAIYGDDARDVETLLSHADIALYRAKVEGRNTYRFHSEAMNVEVRSRVALTDELRLAIPAGQLFLAYQPQVTASGGLVVGVEALVRWRHPRRGVLMPADFLPVAESSGLIGPLGRWVLREACRQGREWIDAGIAPGTISVNLSSAEFKVPFELEKTVLSILAETGYPPRSLELEITETTLIKLTLEQSEAIQRLRSAGVRFALDDFGTGYSSLSYLRHLPIDRIKIASEFVADLPASAESASIVKLIIGLARDLGSKAIAEGVETPEQLDLLSDWGCGEVQGYYYARPMSAEVLAPLLKVGAIKPAATNVVSFAA